jgi:hypothetical protein
MNATRILGQYVGIGIGRQLGDHLLQQVGDAALVRSGDGDGALDAEMGELGEHRLLVQAVGLVHHQEEAAATLAQPGQDALVQRRGAIAAVHHEQHQVGLVHGGARLARGGAGQPLFVTGKAAGVAQRERAVLIAAADAVMAVAGDAWLVMHQGVATARERVENGGFADIRPTHQSDQWQH